MQLIIHFINASTLLGYLSYRGEGSGPVRISQGTGAPNLQVCPAGLRAPTRDAYDSHHSRGTSEPYAKYVDTDTVFFFSAKMSAPRCCAFMRLWRDKNGTKEGTENYED